ncbi:MAG: hypothetical protein KF764_34750 [Labilithrix sp.]|nr:hypothetical protein [Labilithrix sp.]MBX3222939.1 hypothetical protein [Labilithrix sp.]
MAGSDDKTPPAGDKADVVVLGPPTADGAGVHVLRAREERIETGELRSLEEGRPITGEVLTLAPREDNPRVCDVKESFAAGAPAPTPAKAKGPAQVATQAYRDNWEEVFSRRPRNADLN